MIVVNLTGGPKKVIFENQTDRQSFIDFEGPDGNHAKRVLIEARERKTINVTMAGKYVTCISPQGIRMIAVEELNS